MDTNDFSNTSFSVASSDFQGHSGGIKVLPLGGVMPSVAPQEATRIEAPSSVIATPVAAAEPEAVAEPAAEPVAATPVEPASDLSVLGAALDAETAPAAFDTAAPDAALNTEGAVGAGMQMNINKTKVVIKALRAMEENIRNMIKLLEEDAPTGDVLAAASEMESTGREFTFAQRQVDGRVVEGVFDGAGMIGSDGKAYPVPPNYASKSKLVEGDMLKLTITTKGSFIFKQIGPIERERVVGNLGFDGTIGEYYVTEGERKWNVLKASVTYFKGDPDDEAVVLVPKNTPSKWAAVENIMKRNPLG